MGKKEDLQRQFQANVSESIAIGPPRAAPAAAGPSLGRAPNMVGVDRARGGGFRIAIERIVPDPDQPRKTFPDDELDLMARSLAEDGQLEPIRVRWVQEMGLYMIMTGERRYRGSLRAGLKSIECIIDDRDLSPERRHELQLIENCVREDVPPMELARGIRKMMDRGKTQEEVADILKMPRSNVAKVLANLNLAPDLQDKVDSGDLPVHTAYQIARVEDRDAQREIAARVESEGLSATETAALARRVVGPKGKGRGGKKAAPKRLPKQWSFKGGPGVSVVVVAGRKGTDAALAVPILEAALARARSEAPSGSAAA